MEYMKFLPALLILIAAAFISLFSWRILRHLEYGRIDSGITTDRQHAQDQLDLDCMRLINELRNWGEAWTVELICDNPDFDGPNCIVSLFGEWPVAGRLEWTTRNFSGESLLECLTLAKKAVQEAYS